MRHSFIVGVEERSYAVGAGNISVGFPKKEVAAPGLGPGLPQFLRLQAPRTLLLGAKLLSESYLVKDFTAAASSSFTSKTV